MTTTTHSHKPWTSEGGHVTTTPSISMLSIPSLITSAMMFQIAPQPFLSTNMAMLA